jgi:chromate reductase, NAD(P)H dehydrogenase (quinone)
MAAPRILAFAGSARKDSLNKRVLAAAVEGARRAGAEVTHVDLRDWPMPIYDGDLETTEGLPENARRFKTLMKEHAGLLLACPEYNTSITPLLKNTLDWCSRSEPGERALACFDGKVAGLVSASPGALGGLRSLIVVRMMLSNIRVLVLPEQASVPRADQVLDVDGRITDDKLRVAVENVGARLAGMLTRLAG